MDSALAPVLPVSADASAVIVRLPKSWRISFLSVDGKAIQPNAALRILGRDFVTWAIVVPRFRPASSGTLSVLDDSGRSFECVATFADARWEDAYFPIVRQIVRFFRRSKSQSKCEALDRFLSINAAWGAGAHTVYVAPDAWLAIVDLERGGISCRTIEAFARDEAGFENIECQVMATDSGRLLVLMPQGAWQTLFLHWNGQIAQLNLSNMGLKPWSEIEAWMSVQSERTKDALADFWVAAKLRPPGTLEAMALPTSCQLTTPHCRLHVDTVIRGGSLIAALGTVPDGAPEDLQLRIGCGADDPKPAEVRILPGATDGANPGPRRFLAVTHCTASGTSDDIVSLELEYGQRIGRKWLRVANPRNGDAWETLESWMPTIVGDDEFLRRVAMPFWSARWTNVKAVVVSMAEGIAVNRHVGGSSLTVMLVSDGSWESLLLTLAAVALLTRSSKADGEQPPIYVVLADPRFAEGLARQLELWSKTHRISLHIVLPDAVVPPFVALAVALDKIEPKGPTFVAAAGMVPSSAEIIDLISGMCQPNVIDADIVVAPPVTSGQYQPFAPCLLLSSAGGQALRRLAPDFGAIEAAAAALVAQDKLIHRFDSRLSCTFEWAEWTHVSPRLDRIAMADAGWDTGVLEGNIEQRLHEDRPRGARGKGTAPRLVAATRKAGARL